MDRQQTANSFGQSQPTSTRALLTQVRIYFDVVMYNVYTSRIKCGVVGTKRYRPSLAPKPPVAASSLLPKPLNLRTTFFHQRRRREGAGSGKRNTEQVSIYQRSCVRAVGSLLRRGMQGKGLDAMAAAT